MVEMTEMTVSEWIRASILRQRWVIPSRFQDFTELRKYAETKLGGASLQALLQYRSPEFEALRLNRLTLGTLRYEQNGWASYDIIGSSVSRIDLYIRSGNKEHLVDAANLVALEWVQPQHQKSHWCCDRQEETALATTTLTLLGGVVGARALLRTYSTHGKRNHLPTIVDALAREFDDPRHPNAHWQDTHRGSVDDAGGVVEL